MGGACFLAFGIDGVGLDSFPEVRLTVGVFACVAGKLGWLLDTVGVGVALPPTDYCLIGVVPLVHMIELFG